MRFHVLASEVSDNFFTLFEDGQQAILIDPIDATLAQAQLKELGLELIAIVNTHWHPDHVGGNDALLTDWPEAKVYAGATDAEQIRRLTSRGVDVELKGGQSLELGPITFEVIDTPGHTMGHISLRWHDHLFSGDTIFSGGAGHCRAGGDAGVLYRTFDQVLMALPEQVLLYPGHDYTHKNLELGLELLPGDEAISAHIEAVIGKALRWFEPTTIGQERQFNIFLRYREPALRQAIAQRFPALLDEQRVKAGGDEDEAIWRSLRALRDQWPSGALFESKA